MKPSLCRRLMNPIFGIYIPLTCLSAAGLSAIHFAPPFGAWARVSGRPSLGPQGAGFESAGVFNPAVIKTERGFVMLYRAQDSRGTSRIGFAMSEDGVHFRRRLEPAMIPEAGYEKGGGLEDPRVVKIGDQYLMTYTGYNSVDGVGPDR